VRSEPADTHLFIHEPIPPEGLPRVLIEMLRELGQGISVEPAKIIGDDPRAPEHQDPESDGALPGRVLQHPFTREIGPGKLQLPPEYQDFFDDEPQRIIIDSGPCKEIRLYLAVTEHSLENTVIRAFDTKDQLLDEQPIDSLVIGSVNDINDFPDKWKDPSGPWHAPAEMALDYVQTRQNQVFGILVEWMPPDESVRLELVYTAVSPFKFSPAVLTCALEIFRLEEVERSNHDQGGYDAMTQTVENTFNANDLRALLEPDVPRTRDDHPPGGEHHEAVDDHDDAGDPV
jgi:hypothetical protein